LDIVAQGPEYPDPEFASSMAPSLNQTFRYLAAEHAAETVRLAPIALHGQGPGCPVGGRMLIEIGPTSRSPLQRSGMSQAFSIRRVHAAPLERGRHW